MKPETLSEFVAALDSLFCIGYKVEGTKSIGSNPDVIKTSLTVVMSLLTCIFDLCCRTPAVPYVSQDHTKTKAKTETKIVQDQD